MFKIISNSLETLPKHRDYQPFPKRPIDDELDKTLVKAIGNTYYLDEDETKDLNSRIDKYSEDLKKNNNEITDEEIKQLLETLFYKVLNLEFNLFGWSRTMCKYGDFYLYLDLDAEMGIKNVIGLPSREIERLEGEDKNNPNYIQYQWNSAGVTFENWQVAHFRVLGNDKFAPYGTSVLDSSRRIWRQLTLLEDAMMA